MTVVIIIAPVEICLDETLGAFIKWKSRTLTSQISIACVLVSELKAPPSGPMSSIRGG